MQSLPGPGVNVLSGQLTYTLISRSPCHAHHFKYWKLWNPVFQWKFIWNSIMLTAWRHISLLKSEVGGPEHHLTSPPLDSGPSFRVLESLCGNHRLKATVRDTTDSHRNFKITSNCSTVSAVRLDYHFFNQKQKHHPPPSPDFCQFSQISELLYWDLWGAKTTWHLSGFRKMKRDSI